MGALQSSSSAAADPLAHLEDAGACPLGEAHGAHLELGHIKQTDVVSHCGHQHSELGLLRVRVCVGVDITYSKNLSTVTL